MISLRIIWLPYDPQHDDTKPSFGDRDQKASRARIPSEQS